MLFTKLKERSDHRKGSDCYKKQNDVLEVIDDLRIFPTKIKPCETKAEGPKKSTCNIEQAEAAGIHAGNTGKNRGKCPDNRQKATQNQRIASIVLKGLLGIDQVLFLEKN